MLFDLDGRINRKFYWISILALACVAFFLEFVMEAIVRVARPAALQVEVASQAVTLSFFVVLYPTIAIAAKRFHDFDWSAWWVAPLMVLSFVANASSPYMEHGTPEEAVGAWFAVVVLGLVPLVILGSIPGKPGPNQYGPPPS